MLYSVEDGSPRYQVFTQSYSTCHGTKFVWSHQNKDGNLPRTHVASTKMVSNTRAVLHSLSVLPNATNEHQTLLAALHTLENPTLWENMHINGDGEWIQEGLLHGTLSIAHDGSFTQEKLVDLCSAAVIIFCPASNQWAKVLVVEHSESADNFLRGTLRCRHNSVHTTGGGSGPTRGNKLRLHLLQ